MFMEATFEYLYIRKLKMKLDYRATGKYLTFHRKEKSVEVDMNNCLFQPLVDLINKLKPSAIVIRSSSDNKTYLNILKAIFHSELTDFRLKLLIGRNSRFVEDFLF